MTSNDAFLKSKISNFVDYLTVILHKRLDNARFGEFKEKIHQLKTIDTGHFILHVTETMVPYKTNIDQYLDKMLAEHGLKTTDLESDELLKMSRYIRCFIECVSQ